jgi:hypothetical protein
MSVKEPRASQSCILAKKKDAGPLSPGYKVFHGHAIKKSKSDNVKVTQLSLPPEYMCSIGSWANILEMHTSLQNILYWKVSFLL